MFSKPNLKAIKTINYLHDKGHIIKIFTARYMGRNNDILPYKKKYFKQIKKQLDSWGLKYTKLIISKPSADIYIDDRAISFKGNWNNTLNDISTFTVWNKQDDTDEK